MKKMKWFIWASVLAGTIAYGAVIDTTPPPFDDPPSPWRSSPDGSVVTFAFKSSWDGIDWNSSQLAYARDAISQIDEVTPGLTFAESGDFTLRWAGSDFFRDWRDGGTYSAAGWNLSGALAVAYKHNNGPWDPVKYPNNEIYFNQTVPWSYSLLGVDPDSYDFWTVAMHEVIHMISCDTHATHSEEVMFPEIGKGERKALKLSDLDIITAGGNNVTPGAIRPGPKVPDSGSAFFLLLLGFASAALLIQRRTMICPKG